jgi:hypothetical protein
MNAPLQAIEPSLGSLVLQSVPVPRRRQGVPDLDLSEELRSRLIWLAVETEQSVEDVLTLLLNFYREWRQDDDTLTTLADVLTLAKKLAVVEIKPEALHTFLQAKTALAQHNCVFEDVPEALRVIHLFDALPTAWTWDDAEAAMRLVGELLTAKIPIDEVTAFLARHQRLRELGFDDGAAQLLAEALDRAGAVGDRRPAIIERLTGLSIESVDRDRLRVERQELETEVNGLASERDELQAEVTTLQRRRDELQVEWTAKRFELDVLRALKGLLLRKPAAAQAFLKDLFVLRDWLRMGGRQHDWYGGPVVERLCDKITHFIQQLVDEAQS